MDIAIVHDWLTGMRGGERVLERLCSLFPGAPIYTLLWNRGSVSAEIESHPITTSFVQRIPGVARHYRRWLPLFPRAIESLDLSRHEVVISSSHCVAKGARARPGALHLSYVHTPMRYVWELERDYFPPGAHPWPVSWYLRRTCAGLRSWDVATASRPDVMVANSKNVAARIARHYGREAEVIYPPVDRARFAAPRAPGEAYLLAGAFAPYKRGELAIDACQRLGRSLIVAGSGPMEAKLRRHAGRGVEFLGPVSDSRLAQLYAGARALLFPGEEDFGIVPVEALASGCPVVAYGRGGALETVGRNASSADLDRVARGEIARVPGGVLFGTQSVESLCEAILELEATPPDPATLGALTEPFDAERFDQGFLGVLERALDRRRDTAI